MVREAARECNLTVGRVRMEEGCAWTGSCCDELEGNLGREGRLVIWPSGSTGESRIFAAFLRCCELLEKGEDEDSARSGTLLGW